VLSLVDDVERTVVSIVVCLILVDKRSGLVVQAVAKGEVRQTLKLKATRRLKESKDRPRILNTIGSDAALRLLWFHLAVAQKYLSTQNNGLIVRHRHGLKTV
jgi:signal transduction histidine kinase